MKRLLLVLMVLLTGLGCNLPAVLPTIAPPPTAPVPPSAPTVSMPALTLDSLRNATYDVSEFVGAPYIVTLVDGQYASGNDPMAENYLFVQLGDQVAFGDLNYDGVDDAAVVLAINAGGTGVFTYLAAVLNVGGSPLHVASVFLDDRPQVNSLNIVAGEVIAQAIVHGPDDPGCCPSQPVEVGYRLYGNALVLTYLASQTPSGFPRRITITFPSDLVTLALPFPLTGYVTVGPFENTLAYQIYGPDNTLLERGSVMTDSPNPGDPGNFSISAIDLSPYGVHGLVRIEIVEYSMQDGSVMTMDSVLVNIP